MKYTLLNETPVFICELKTELAKIKDRDKELSFRAQKTADYLETVTPITDKNCKELIDKLSKLDIPRLKPQHLFKLADILPTKSKDVKTILQAYSLTITNDNLDKIAQTIAEFAPKK